MIARQEQHKNQDPYKTLDPHQGQESTSSRTFEKQGSGGLNWLLFILSLWFSLILAGMVISQGEYRPLKFWVAAAPLVFFSGIWLFSLLLRAKRKPKHD